MKYLAGKIILSIILKVSLEVNFSERSYARKDVLMEYWLQMKCFHVYLHPSHLSDLCTQASNCKRFNSNQWHLGDRFFPGTIITRTKQVLFNGINCTSNPIGRFCSASRTRFRLDEQICGNVSIVKLSCFIRLKQAKKEQFIVEAPAKRSKLVGRQVCSRYYIYISVESEYR